MVSHQDLCASFSRGSWLRQAIIETSYKGWEPWDSRIGSLAQSVCYVAERGGEGIELKQGYRVGLSSKARPVELLSMTFNSR